MKRHLQFQNDSHDLSIFKRVVDLDQPGMLQRPHYLYLSLHVAAVLLFGAGYELGRQTQPRRFLLAFVHGPELAPETKGIQSVRMTIE